MAQPTYLMVSQLIHERIDGLPLHAILKRLRVSQNLLLRRPRR